MKTLIWLCSVLFLTSTFAHTYFIHPVEVSDKTDKNTGNVVKELITSAIYEYGHDLSMTKDSSAHELQAKVLKLSTHYLITLTEMNNEGIVTNNKRAKINSLDKIDTAIDSICNEIFSETKAIRNAKKESTQTFNKKNEQSERTGVSRPKTQEANSKVNALTFQNFSFGPAWFNGFNNSAMAYHFSYGRFWEVHPSAAVKLQGQLNTNYQDGLAMFLAGALGLNYYLMSGEISPYIGADFGYGIASFDTESLDAKIGFNYGLSVGTLLFRSSTVQIGIDLTHRILLPKVNGEHPRATSVSLGINL